MNPRKNLEQAVLLRISSCGHTTEGINSWVWARSGPMLTMLTRVFGQHLDFLDVGVQGCRAALCLRRTGQPLASR